MSVEFTDVNDSKMIDENLNRAKSMQWPKAVRSELDSLQQKQTWHLIDQNVVYCKWIFKHNPGTDGQI